MITRLLAAFVLVCALGVFALVFIAPPAPPGLIA